MRTALGLFVTMAMLGATSPARAGNESVYTPLNLDQCQMEPLPPEEEDPVAGGVFWCLGHDDMPVRVAEGDLRFFVSFGANAANEPAARETVSGFNRIHTTLEWRVPGDGGQAFATILRYFEMVDGTTEEPVLVVTRLGGPGQVCHVGTVAVRRNPDANVIAREIADRVAPIFRCGVDRVVTYGPGMRP